MIGVEMESSIEVKMISAPRMMTTHAFFDFDFFRQRRRRKEREGKVGSLLYCAFLSNSI